MKFLPAFSLLVFLIACTEVAHKEKMQETSAKETSAKYSYDSENAAALYNQNCATCHQKNGAGLKKLYPPLTETQWVNGDKERLIGIILNGLNGPIEVNGVQYNNRMPAAAYLSDADIAQILTYTRSNFGNNSSAVSPEEVAKVRSRLD